MRETSLESFRQIRESGILSERRMEVYSLLFEFGPATGSELAQIYRESKPNSPPNQANIVTRLGELRDMGIATEVRTRPCTVTGMNVIEWDVTSRLPIPLKKKAAARRIFIQVDLFDTVTRVAWESFPGAIEFKEVRS